MFNTYILYTLTGQVIWGLLPLFWLLLRDVPAPYILATRIIWASIFCYGLICYKHLRPALGAIRQLRSQWAYMAGACVVITVNWGTFIYAMTHGEIIQASLAYFISPILVILCGAVLFKETLGTLQKISIFFATTGLVIAFVLFGAVPYISLVLCTTWAAYSILKKRITVDSQVSVFIESVSMVPLSLAFIVWSEMHGLGAYGVLSGWQWLLLPATGVVTAVPMLFFTAGIKGTPITFTGIFMYLSPSISFVIGLLHGEILTPPLVITFVFAWIAIAFYIVGLFRLPYNAKKFPRKPSH